MQDLETRIMRSMINNRVEINLEVMLGKPVIRRTRIPVELILRKLSEGATEGDLLDADLHGCTRI